MKEKKRIIGILGGTGEFGGAFAEYFRKRGETVLVSGRKTALTPEKLTEQSDIVLLSVPISAVEETCEKIAPYLRKESLLMDFCSVKEAPLQSMMNAFSGEVFGCHPLFGPKNILPGQPVVLCPGRGKTWLPIIHSLFQEFRIVQMDAKTHDKRMGIIQGLQHFLENAFAETIRNSAISVEELLNLSSPVYRLQMDIIGRILGHNESLYGEIVYGSEISRKTIADFLENAQQLFEADRSTFEKHFRENRLFFGDFCEKAQNESDAIITFLAEREKSSSPLDSQHSLPKKKTSIGTLGPKYTWSDLARHHFFPKDSYTLFPNFSSILFALEKGDIDYGFFPLENSISGAVRQVWSGIVEHNFWIDRVFKFSISHVLASPASTKTINTVFGHPEAIAQCSQFLRQHYPHANSIPVTSTAESVRHAEHTANSAALCSRFAAEVAHFSLLAEDIADMPGNTTRFGLVRKRTAKDEGQKKTGITSVFFELHNEPGALITALRIFSETGKNLLRIESKPTGKNFSEYGFFVDFEGGASDDWKTRFQKETVRGKILGQYERNDSNIHET